MTLIAGNEENEKKKLRKLERNIFFAKRIIDCLVRMKINKK